MRVVKQVEEDDVFQAYLVGELRSERFGPALLGLLDQHGIAESALTDPSAVPLRRWLLGEHRGWGRNEGLFDGFPADVSWFRAALTPPEVLSILYINWDWWLEASGGTRRPGDAARGIRAGLVAGVDAGLPVQRPHPELIVLTTPTRSKLVCVEGHARLTAYALHPESLPPELEVFLGESEAAESWSEF